MWLEIVSTAIIASVATHLLPQMYTYVRAKLKPSPQMESPSPLGRVVSIDHESKVIQMNVVPAQQRIMLANNKLDPESPEKTIPLATKVVTGADLEEEIAEAARDREISTAEMATYVMNNAHIHELEVEFAVLGPAADWPEVESMTASQRETKAAERELEARLKAQRERDAQLRDDAKHRLEERLKVQRERNAQIHAAKIRGHKD